jgi:hypothetical protein
MKINHLTSCLAAISIGAIALYTGCKPETVGTGNGLSSPNLKSSFTLTPVAGKTNYYALNANTDGVLAVKWDKGTGGGSSLGKAIDTAFYPDAGTYNVTLTAVGIGGQQVSSTQTVNVATSDPLAGNLVAGSKMQPGDDAFWTHMTITPGVSFTMSNGQMTGMGGNNGHGAVYQAINVVAGRKYMVDMTVSGSGATDTWFEVYVGTQVPVAGQDYSSGGKLISLNTWAGCGKGNFSGKLSTLSCSGSGNTVTFANSGTVYLFIKSGGSNLGTTGISFTNVEFRGIK